MKGRVIAISISDKKGTPKNNVGEGCLKANYGLEGDAHAGSWHRQVSLLASESIDLMRKKGLKVVPGDFAENITTEGIELTRLSPGIQLKVGKEAILKITQIGKICHSRCDIYYQAGDCVMPREGVFAKVIKGGVVKSGDEIEVILPDD